MRTLVFYWSIDSMNEQRELIFITKEICMVNIYCEYKYYCQNVLELVVRTYVQGARGNPHIGPPRPERRR